MAKRVGRSKVAVQKGDIENGGKSHEGIVENLPRTGVTAEERRELISKAAYSRSERRGFAPGADLQDWLEAEAEVDEMLRKAAADSQPKST